MPFYSVADIRKMIDDLDDILRAAVVNGNLEEVFRRERRNVDGLMRTSRDSREIPALQVQFQMLRFVWVFTEAWRRAKKNNAVDAQFWASQQQVLRDFDQKYPNNHRDTSGAATTGTASSAEPPQPLSTLPVTPKHDERHPRLVAPPPLPPQAGSSRQPPPRRKFVWPDIVNEGEAVQYVQHLAVPESQGAAEVTRLKKGKQRMIEEMEKETEGEEDYKEEEDEQEEDEQEEEEEEEESKDNVPPQADKVEKKRKPPQGTGRLREPACRRCVRLGRDCFEQVGGMACVTCAKTKMKCSNVEDGDDRRQPAPAPAPVPSKKPVKGPATAPTRPLRKKKEAEKVRVVGRTRPVPAPQPKPPARRPPTRPAPTSKARRAPKKVKSATVIASSPDAERDDEVPVKRTFAELERQDDGDYLEGIIHNLQNKVDVLQQELLDVNEKMQTTENIVDTLQLECDDLTNKLEAKDRQVEELSDRIDRAEKQLRKLLTNWSQGEGRRKVDVVPLPRGSAEEEPAPALPLTLGEAGDKAGEDVVPLVDDAVEGQKPALTSQVLDAQQPQESRAILLPLDVAEGPAPKETLDAPVTAPVVVAGSVSTQTIAAPADEVALAVPDPAAQMVSAPDPAIVPSSSVPPPLPTSSAVSMNPVIKLQPPTPQNSQEAAEYGLTTLLHVPAPSVTTPPLRCQEPPPISQAASTTRSRSRSRSPVPPPSELRRSPRIRRSPSPGASVIAVKRPADISEENPAAKKRREG